MVRVWQVLAGRNDVDLVETTASAAGERPGWARRLMKRVVGG